MIDKGSEVLVYGGDIGLRLFAFGNRAIVNEVTRRTVKVTFLDTFPGEQAEFALQQCIPLHQHEEEKVAIP